MKLLTASLFAFTALSTAALADTPSVRDMDSYGYISKLYNVHQMQPQMMERHEGWNGAHHGKMMHHHDGKHHHHHDGAKDGEKHEGHHHHHHHDAAKDGAKDGATHEGHHHHHHHHADHDKMGDTKGAMESKPQAEPENPAAQ